MTGLFYLAAVIAIVWLGIWAASDQDPGEAVATKRRTRAGSKRRWNPFEYAIEPEAEQQAETSGAVPSPRSGYRQTQGRVDYRHAPSSRSGVEPQWRLRRRTQRTAR